MTRQFRLIEYRVCAALEPWTFTGCETGKGNQQAVSRSTPSSTRFPNETPDLYNIPVFLSRSLCVIVQLLKESDGRRNESEVV